MFHRLSKQLQFHQKYSVTHHIFNSFLGVWISSWNTVSCVWYTCTLYYIKMNLSLKFQHLLLAHTYISYLYMVCTRTYKYLAWHSFLWSRCQERVALENTLYKIFIDYYLCYLTLLGLSHQHTFLSENFKPTSQFFY